MRRLLYIACVICVACLCGCDTPDLFGGGSRDAEMVLRLSLGSLTRSADTTRADGVPVIELNENKVSSIEIFLYANNATDTTDAVYATRLENLDKNESFNLSLSLPAPVVETLFSRNTTTCKVYAVANYATGCTDNLERSSVAELKSLPLDAEFDKTYEVDLGTTYGTLKSVKPQELFVMDSDVCVVTKGDKSITGTVQLSRAASKITFRTTIAQKVVINGKTWTPMLDRLELNYHNIVNKGFVDNGSDTNNTFTMPTGQGIYANVEGMEMSSIYSDNGATEPNYGSEVEGASDWVTIDHVVPFYSYSSSWTDGAENEAHITMTIPWVVMSADGEANTATLTYYSYYVPINMTDLKLVRNKHYRINMRVGVLGDIEIEQINDTTFSYEVVDWVGQDIEASLQKPLYLEVESNYVEMYNLETYSVGYQSSDEVAYKVTSTTIAKFTTDRNGVIVSGCVHTKYDVTAQDGHVTFSHELDNTISDKDTEYDFIVQTTVVRIYHKNNQDIYQDITFVQYPAMYVSTEKGNNSTSILNYITVNGHTTWGSNGAGGGCPQVNRETVYWVGLGGKTASGLNPNIYKISVSAFDDTTANYIIADPRAEPTDITVFPAYNNGNLSKSPQYAVQPDQLGVTTIKGYRGTRVEGSENLVAPEFIVASFLSTCTCADEYLFSENSAYYRCAGYQEAGYPAGRWRLPTAAEIDVIGKLCVQNKLPSIFTASQNYPSSTGNYSYNKTEGTFMPTSNKATSVRCVYDTWYWRDKCKINENNKGVRLLWGADGNVQDMKDNGVYDTYLQLVE